MAVKFEFVKGLLLTVALASSIAASGQTADQAWLHHGTSHFPLPVPMRVWALGQEQLENTAANEIVKGIDGVFGSSSRTFKADPEEAIVLGTVQQVRSAFPLLDVPTSLPPEAFWITDSLANGKRLVVIAGGSERGVLYGAFALIRELATSGWRPGTSSKQTPAMPIRWVDEWDNPDGSIERGYAGRSIFFDGGNVRQDLSPVAEYARLLASVGINGCNVNNVNAAPQLLDSDHIRQLARIADAMRPWGVRLAMSVAIASPQTIGGLATYDPLDPAVKAWWAAKVNEIYSQIPDFAGFTVKADSEGQPGPASYGRTPADAANLLALALKPHAGVVLYRAFVYNHHADWRDPKADRARAAYDIFQPLDGKFADNVIVQTKEGPIDFQAREPVSPLFAGLRQTSQAMEVQITQEYTGQQRHLVYLAPMWKEVLDFDLRADNRPTPVKEILAGKAFQQPLGGIVGVAGVGQNAWLGSPLAIANLYAFGRLAWNPDLIPEQIADEWIRQSISDDPQVVSTVEKMLMQSWPAYESYTGPLGMQTLTDITGSHYGPNIESSENNGWGQWHRADHEGVGMDRTVATGTGYTGQYPADVAKLYGSLLTCPDELLLFFHHVPYNFHLQSGKTVIQHIYDSHYDGAAQAAELVEEWKTLKSRIDPALYNDVLARLEYQAGHAIVWRDAIVQYFFKLTGIADDEGRAGHYPGRMEAEDARLSGYKVIDVIPWEDASGGKAVICGDLAPNPGRALNQGTTSKPALSEVERVPNTAQKEGGAGRDGFQPIHLSPGETRTCSAEWTYSGEPGRFNLAAQYFDLPGGTAHFALYLNGLPAASWAADATLPSRRPNGDNSTRKTTPNVELNPGDVIRIDGAPDGADPAALDYIEVLPFQSEPIKPRP
jgi:alpha-glucuronidase